MSKFQQLKDKLAKKPGIKNPGGLAYSIGKKKFGKGVMAKAAASGRSAQSVADTDKDGE